MKRFLKTIALFLVPVLLLFALFTAVYIRSGENISTAEIANEMIADEPVLMGLAYRDDTRTVKHLVASGVQADLLVLGTSRSMQFRGQFFETDSFYNAGGGAVSLPELLFFLQHLPEDALPETLLIVLDQYFYNSAWGTSTIDEFGDYVFRETAPTTNIRRCMQDYAMGKYSIIDVLTSPTNEYGMSASTRGAGFYTDGSYTYGTDILETYTVESAMADSYQRIDIGSDRFEYGDNIDPRFLQKTEELLAFCAAHDIQVVAILPPYAPSVYSKMQETGKYGYMDLIYPTLQPLFATYGFEVFDYTSLPETTDDMYVDGFHGGDRVYALITAHLANESTILAPYLHAAYLEELFYAEGHPLTVPVS